MIGPASAHILADKPMRPETVVRKFYLWYIGTVDEEVDAFGAGRAILKKYVTQHLIRAIEKGQLPGNASDEFLQTSVWSGGYAMNMKVSKPVIH